MPAEYIRKQTVKNAERYTTPELDDRQRQVLGAEDEATRREIELLEQLRLFVAEHRARLDRATAVLAEIDVLVALADVARSRGWVRPEITEGTELLIDAGRHPVLEELLPHIESIELAGDVKRVRSNFVNGVKKFPVRVTWSD